MENKLLNKKILTIFFILFFTLIFFITQASKVLANCCCLGYIGSDRWCQEAASCDLCERWKTENFYQKKFERIETISGGCPSQMMSNCFNGVFNPITGTGGQAEQNLENTSAPIVPKLSIPIPGLNLTSDVKLLRVCSECKEVISDASACPDDKCVKWTYKIPWIGEYIFAFYKWAVSAIAIFAVLVIVNAAFSMVTAGGNSAKITAARDSLFAGIIGVILILIAHQAFYMVDPRLVVLKPIIIGSIKRIETDVSVVSSGADSNAAAISSNVCGNENDLIRIDSSKFGGVSASDPRLLPATYQALLNAQMLAKQAGKSIYITSAFRTLAHQQSLWNEAVATYGSESAAATYVARPSCGAPHLTGGAVDVCLAGTSSCNQIAGKYARYSSDDIVALQNFMTQAGFVRYCGEWWHFEYGTQRWENGKNLPPGPGKCK